MSEPAQENLKPFPERYAVEYRDVCTPPVPSESWEWETMRYESMIHFAKKLLEELGAAEASEKRLEERRKSTQRWYAGRYGKLHDWARKWLPEPWSTQFFSCVANGLYSATEDLGKPYMSAVGPITPSGYFVLDTAQEQILYEQSRRAEDAEVREFVKDRLLAAYRKSHLYQGCKLIPIVDARCPICKEYDSMKEKP